MEKEAVREQFHLKDRSLKGAEKTLYRYGKEVLEDEAFIASGENIQHGDMSVREHCVHVARMSVFLAAMWHIPVYKKDLVRGALLHDYFQYDWHSPQHCGLKNLHGFYHPGIALKNAEKAFVLADCEREIILRHMWPLTVVPARYREAWIVTTADKICSLTETLKFEHGTRKYSRIHHRRQGGKRC